jgi:hypothetical protein
MSLQPKPTPPRLKAIAERQRQAMAREAVKHIVEAVTSTGRVAFDPETFDYVRLSEALDERRLIALARKELSNAGRDNARRVRAGRVAKATDALVALLGASTPDDHAKWLVQRLDGAGANVPMLLGLLKTIGAECSRISSNEALCLFDSDNTLELLVGVELPVVYAQAFGSVGISRSSETGQVEGPYVRFAIAVTKEFGWACTASSIETYWKKQRAMRAAALKNMGICSSNK